jgi:hypothetical protein
VTHDLPLPDYDNLPTEAIGTRARTLDRQGVQTLLDYEQDHAGRPAVVQLLTTRLDELDDGAQPSGGLPLAEAPEAGRPGGGGQPSVKEGPPVNPPSHGTPENPAQPRH